MAAIRIILLILLVAVCPFPNFAANPDPPIQHLWIKGTNDTARLGMGIAGGRDVNGDKFPDLVFSFDRMGANESAMAGLGIIYGGTNVIAAPKIEFIPVTLPQASFGHSMTLADFNGDGFADAAVGARKLRSPGATNGGVFIVYGRKEGLTTNSILLGNAADNIIGFGSVVSAGDFNGDGYSDLAVGATYNAKEPRPGAVFVYYGTSTGLPVKASWTLQNKDSTEKLSGQTEAAADLNGDGFADLLVAASRSISPSSITIFPGSKEGILASREIIIKESGFVFRIAAFGDYNKNKCNELLVTLSNAGSRRQRKLLLIEGAPKLSGLKQRVLEQTSYDSEWGYSLGNLGDIDQDGLPDLLVAAPSEHLNGRSSGAAYLFLGRNGLGSPAEWYFEGTLPRMSYGYAVGPAGDLNGDGMADFAIGSGLYNSGFQSQAGRLDLFFGSPNYKIGRRWKAPEEGFVSWTNPQDHPQLQVASIPITTNYTSWLLVLALSLALSLLIYKRRVNWLVTAERHRLARDLHDGLGASLARISLLSKSTVETENNSGLPQAVRDAVSAAQQAVWLVNPAYDTLENLATFLCDHAEKICHGTTVNCVCTAELQLPEIKLQPDVRKNVFLAVNEALTNSLKHSQATELNLSISYLAGKLSIKIQDNGRGFQNASSQGNGLKNMKHRMEVINGKVEWFSKEKGGTRVSINVPI